MAPRRAHTKSRNGCDQCKKRRVKCDERGPPCSNCISRELHCTYTKTSAARTVANSSSASPAPVPHAAHRHPEAASYAFTAAGTTSPPNFSRKKELELMHKYSTETYQSLSNEPAYYQVWQMFLPRKALEFDFLMNGILAVASLHTAASIDSSEALSYIDSALEYHNQASAPYRQAIDNISPINCDAVFAHAIITTVIGIALPQLTADRIKSTTMTENIFVVFELLQGVRNIHKISRDWLQTPFFTSRHGFFDVPYAALDADVESSFTQLTATNDLMLEKADPDQHRIMNDAIELLRRCYRRFAHAHDAASVISWLSSVDKEFVHALRGRPPISLLVLMHWAVLLDELDGEFWWARNSGSSLGAELLRDLRSGDPRLEGAWTWPKEKMSI
ncbi:Zn(II)2Cys6 transcription factor domain-containing protein [Aspergillus affinis]|uniref:Zn(II)2Cys6 transcription factor domain-containing protein n=1 Tax=Aspergillus affinis TaxID=1070780 RepID=UPI0022FECAA4|nr:C6 transcription factor [Aspergillus affinis]KAI9039831.1 C6 transcription factor [Aspergillus affinis]